MMNCKKIKWDKEARDRAHTAWLHLQEILLEVNSVPADAAARRRRDGARQKVLGSSEYPVSWWEDA